MTEIVEFWIPGEPKGKQRPQFNSVNKEAFTPMQTLNYEEYVKWFMYTHFDALEKQVLRFKDDEPLFLFCTSYHTLPKGKRRKYDQSMGLLYPTVKPDFDNVSKIIADALNTIVYPDDKQIVGNLTGKRYADPDTQRAGVRCKVQSMYTIPQELLDYII